MNDATTDYKNVFHIPSNSNLNKRKYFKEEQYKIENTTKYTFKIYPYLIN